MQLEIAYKLIAAFFKTQTEELAEDNDSVKYLRSDSSMTAMLSPTIIEPLIVVSESLKATDNITKVIESNIDIFASYYMQSFKYMVDIMGIETAMALEVLSSTRAHYDIGKEDYAPPIESQGSFLNMNNSKQSITVSLEKMDDTGFEVPKLYSKTIEIKIVSKDSNNRKSKITRIPITIKPAVVFASSQNILAYCDPSRDSFSFLNRLLSARVSEISWKNFILCGDLRKNYRQNKLKDEKGLLTFLTQRKSMNLKRIAKNQISGFRVASKSLGAYHATLILSTGDKKLISTSTDFNLTNYKEREKFLTEIATLLLTTVDSQYEMITYDTKDISGSSVIDFSDLSKRKSNGNDLSEIIKHLIANKPPF